MGTSKAWGSKKEYHEYNIYTMRKCPECGSTDYERQIALSLVTVKVGHTIRHGRMYHDAGGWWECVQCKVRFLQDGEVLRQGQK